MTLESLLVTRDQQVIGVLRSTMEKLSIDVEVCHGAHSGSEILGSEKFDAVIVDCDDLEGGLEVLESLRKSPSNRNSVTFAILNGNTTTQAAFDMGAKFVLQKPISVLNATRCFSAALSFMLRERRRYFRHPVEMVVAFRVRSPSLQSDSHQPQRRRHGDSFSGQAARGRSFHDIVHAAGGKRCDSGQGDFGMGGRRRPRRRPLHRAIR